MQAPRPRRRPAGRCLRRRQRRLCAPHRPARGRRRPRGRGRHHPLRRRGEVPLRALLERPLTLLQLRYADYEDLRAHGEETYPHECCGILLGHAAPDVNQVRRIVRAGNTRTDSAHNRYHIAPEELVRAQREGRRDGLDIVGFYHSHPDHPAQWSRTDLDEAHWIGCSYVITAVEQGKAAITNSFLLRGTGESDKNFAGEALELDVTGVDDHEAKTEAAKSVQLREGEEA